MTGIDFAVLPPEVNSGRMYAGAGSVPLVSAAASWDRLAAELGSAAGSYRTVISELADEVWQGPAAASMTAAAEPYMQWMSATAAQAAQAANQARAAAAAYQQAFAATVPPAVIAANRAALASLVSRNILGQNAAAIAANQAQYGEMWAQDAAAMYGYAGDSAVATRLTPFPAAPQNTNPAGTANQAAAVGQATVNSAHATLSAVPHALSTMGSTQATPFQPLVDIVNTAIVKSLNGTSLNLGLNAVLNIGAFDTDFSTQLLILASYLLPAAAGAQAAADASMVSFTSALPEGALGSTLAGSYQPVTAVGSGGLGAPVSAGLHRAVPVGGLSVPQSWTKAAPGIRFAVATLPTAGLDAAPEAAPTGGFAGAPPAGGMVNAPGNDGPRPRYGPQPKVIPQLMRAPGVDEIPSDQWVQPGRRAVSVASTLTDLEREELETLRDAAIRLESERQAAALLVRDKIRSCREEVGS